MTLTVVLVACFVCRYWHGRCWEQGAMPPWHCDENC